MEKGLSDIKEITSIELEEWKEKVKSCKTIGEGKAKGREFRDKYNLTDLQATNILFRNYLIKDIL